jgi:hypothetical protein
MASPDANSAGNGTNGGGEISTFGWDTAFAVRIENVNAAIKSRKVSPPHFSYTDPSDPKVYCTGDFGDWAVVRGGDGGGVNLQLPIQNVSGQMQGTSGYVPYSCAGASVIYTVRLTFFDTGQQQQKKLMVNPTSDSQDVPVIEPYSADFSQHPVNPAMAVYAIQAALMNWCTSNLGAFLHVFSIVDLNDEADQGAWAFLKPTEVSYAYVDGPTDVDAFLGVLAMTMGESAGGLQQVLDARIVQAGEEGAFCISRLLLFKKLIFPNLQTLWPNLQASQVTLSENAIQLNPNETVTLPQTEYQGTYYLPQLQKFSFTIEGPQITIEAYTVTDVQDGVQAWCRTTARYTIVKSTNKSGQTTLAYQQLGDPQTSNGHYIDEKVEITDAILAAVLALALAVLAALTGGAAAVVITIVGALIVGLIASSPQINGLIENNDAPAIDLLQENIYAPIVWTDSQDFTISAVDLDGSIRLGGALGFGSASSR